MYNTSVRSEFIYFPTPLPILRIIFFKSCIFNRWKLSHFYLKHLFLHWRILFIEKWYFFPWTTCSWPLLVFVLWHLCFCFLILVYKSSLVRVVILLFAMVQELSHLSFILTWNCLMCHFQKLFHRVICYFYGLFPHLLWMLKPSPPPKLYKYLLAFSNNINLFFFFEIKALNMVHKKIQWKYYSITRVWNLTSCSYTFKNSYNCTVYLS